MTQKNLLNGHIFLNDINNCDFWWGRRFLFFSEQEVFIRLTSITELIIKKKTSVFFYNIKWF